MAVFDGTACTVTVLGSAELVDGWKLDGAFEAAALLRSFHAVFCCWLDSVRLSPALACDDENNAAAAGADAKRPTNCVLLAPRTGRRSSGGRGYWRRSRRNLTVREMVRFLDRLRLKYRPGVLSI